MIPLLMWLLLHKEPLRRQEHGAEAFFALQTFRDPLLLSYINNNMTSKDVGPILQGSAQALQFPPTLFARLSLGPGKRGPLEPSVAHCYSYTVQCDCFAPLLLNPR
jgi:hypothetical protein